MALTQEKYIYAYISNIVTQNFEKVHGSQSKYPCIKPNPLGTPNRSRPINLYLPRVLKGTWHVQ